MSWHLLVPVVEKLIDIGVEYYNSSSNEPQKAIVESKETTTTTSEASILITVEKEGGIIDESTLRSAIEKTMSHEKLKITAITIDIQEESNSGS